MSFWRVVRTLGFRSEAAAAARLACRLGLAPRTADASEAAGVVAALEDDVDAVSTVELSLGAFFGGTG